MFVGMMVTASGQFLLGLNDFIYIRFVTELLENFYILSIVICRRMWLIYIGMMVTALGSSFATIPAYEVLIRIAGY